MTPEKYEQILDDFASIIDSEFNQVAILEGSAISAAELNLLQLCMNTNAWGLMSTEFIDAIVSAYNSESDFRRILGSTAMRFQTTLELKYGFGYRDFAKAIIGIVGADSQVKPNDTSVTVIDLLQTRLRFEDRHNGDLLHVNDFWIICVFLFRLNIHRSSSYQLMVTEREALRKAKLEADIRVTEKMARAAIRSLQSQKPAAVTTSGDA